MAAKTKLTTMLGTYPNTTPLKSGAVKSDLVDFDDAEHVTVERLGSLVAARHPESDEDKAIATGCNDRRRESRRPEVCGRPHVRDVDVTSA